MTVGQALAAHLRRAAHPGASRPLCVGLLGGTLEIESLLSSVRGRTFDLAGASLEVPRDLRWSLVRSEAVLRIGFHDPRPVVETRRLKFFRLRASISGLTLDLERIVLHLAGFPDFTLDLDWSCRA